MIAQFDATTEPSDELDAQGVASVSEKRSWQLCIYLDVQGILGTELAIQYNE